jgi:hypothetical protein
MTSGWKSASAAFIAAASAISARIHRHERIEIARIGELIDDKDMMVGGGYGMPHEGGADEPCSTRHQETLRHQAPVPTNAAVCRFFAGNARSAAADG